MAEDLRFELAILATVQGFYQKLMGDALGGDVPIPSGLDEDALRRSHIAFAKSREQIVQRFTHGSSRKR